MILLEQQAKHYRFREVLSAFVRNAAFVQWGLLAVAAAMLAIAYLSSLAHGRGPIIDGVPTEPFLIPGDYILAAAVVLPAWFLAARALGTWDQASWPHIGRARVAAILLLTAPGIVLTILLAPLMILNSASPCRR